MSTALATLTTKLAARLDMGDNGSELMTTLKATAFKGQVSDSQMTALLIVANQFGLNPWTREIYAFPDKNNGIVPVVGVDGWSRIINNHAQFDGMEFEQDGDSCTCRIYRKDRARPVAVTEYMDECKRGTAPWTSHPKRMLRHKAMIQCARLAFGYGGIYDQDEAERIVDMGPADVVPITTATRTEAVKGKLLGDKPSVTLEQVKESIAKAETMDALAATADLAAKISKECDKKLARAAYANRAGELKASAQPTQPDPQDEALRQVEQAGRVDSETGEWHPSPEEEAAIREREKLEAGGDMFEGK